MPFKSCSWVLPETSNNMKLTAVASNTTTLIQTFGLKNVRKNNNYETNQDWATFSELHNAHFYDVLWNQDSINLWNILLGNMSTHVHCEKRTVDHRVLVSDVPMSLFLSKLSWFQATSRHIPEFSFPVLKQLCILQDLKCFSCSKVTEEFDLQANFKMNGRLNQTANIKDISIVLTSDPLTFNELS